MFTASLTAIITNRPQTSTNMLGKEVNYFSLNAIINNHAQTFTNMFGKEVNYFSLNAIITNHPQTPTNMLGKEVNYFFRTRRTIRTYPVGNLLPEIVGTMCEIV